VAQEGGWTRQTTIREMPSSRELAGVNMRLDEGVIRELHWHTEAEWAYVLTGRVRVGAPAIMPNSLLTSSR
jgi:oxalate decarboxylase/phosphoglucose isomerase-like protein (cupin superfamily)